MAIAFQCPRCQSQIQVSDQDAGAKLRCPSCKGKVRVPDAPAPPPVVASRIAAPGAAISTKIDFLCPRCSTEMSARAEHAGIKQFCPKCGGKVRVPVPQAGQAASAVEEQPATAAVPESPVAGSIASLVDDDELEGLPLPMSRRRRRKKNYLGWIIPVACLGLLAAIGSILLKKPPVKFEGKLTGDRLTDTELGPARIDNNRLGRSKRDAQSVFDNLENSPVRAVTQSSTMEFKGATGGIEISLRSSDQADFYRIDPTKDKRLAAFIDDNKQKFRGAVDAELDRSVPEFLQAVEKRSERDREVQGLAEFRDSVGMASLMRGTGFGYHVQAAIGKQAYPCLMEDNQGRLFFALLTGTQEFELVGRDRAPKSAKDAARFTGRYTVRISEQTITIKKEAPDGNEKVRKALRK